MVISEKSLSDNKIKNEEKKINEIKYKTIPTYLDFTNLAIADQNKLNFEGVNNAEFNKIYQSKNKIIFGIEKDTKVEIIGTLGSHAKYSISRNGGKIFEPWTNFPGKISNGDAIRVQLSSPKGIDKNNLKSSATLFIGGKALHIDVIIDHTLVDN